MWKHLAEEAEEKGEEGEGGGRGGKTRGTKNEEPPFQYFPFPVSFAKKSTEPEVIWLLQISSGWTNILGHGNIWSRRFKIIKRHWLSENRWQD